MVAKPKTAALSVVENRESVTEPARVPTPEAVEDDALGAVERAMDEIIQEQRPLVQRAETRRQRIAQEAREVETLIDDLNQREALLDRLVEAGKRAIKQQRDDLEEELALLHHGIVGSVNAQGHSHDA